MKRLECLDGLRGLLAVYVMTGHMAPFALLPSWLARAVSHGSAAVDVFFILSGLVIVQSLESFAWQPRGFLIARAARTFPAYLVALAIAVGVQAAPTDFSWFPWIGPESVARVIWSVGWPTLWPIDIASHLTMTHGLLPDGVVPGGWVSFLGSAWSLSTEWQFYVLALLIGLYVGPKRMIPMFLVLAVAGLVWQASAPETWRFSRAFMPNKAQYFALGIASAAVVRGRAGAVRAYAIVLGSTLALCAAQGGVDKLAAPLVWTLCMGAQLRPDRRVLHALSGFLRSKPMLRLGALSYCIYLVNEPVQKAVGLALAVMAQGDARVFTAAWVPVALLLPVAVAAWLHVVVEQPALRFGRALARGGSRHRAGCRLRRRHRRDRGGQATGRRLRRALSTPAVSARSIVLIGRDAQISSTGVCGPRAEP